MPKRRWELDLEDGHHVVEFQQGYFLGTRKATVDGVTTTERGRPFQDHSGQYPVALPGHTAAVWVSTNGFTYSYDLVIDGRSASSSAASPRLPRPPVGTPRQLATLGAIFLVGAAVLGAFAAKLAFDEYRYNVASVTVGAIVSGKSTTSGRSGTTYYLRYTFADAEARVWRGEDSVPRSAFDEALPGSRYFVTYLIDEPGTSRFTGKDNVIGVAFMTVLTIGGLFLGALMLRNGRRRLSIARRVAEVGQPVMATVTKAKRGYVRGVGQTITVEYEYDDPFGKRRKGRGPLMYPQEGLAYKVGGPVRVLIDPDKPADSLLP